MKNLCVLTICLGFLFLTGCQKSEEVTAADDDAAITFKKAGDPRDPAEFMSPEDIKMIQEAFNDMKGKKLENPVIEIEQPLTKGNSVEVDQDIYLLQDMNVPTNCFIEGKRLYVCIMIMYYEKKLTFSTNITYRLGEGAAYQTGYKSYDNTTTYFIDDPVTGKNRILIDENCNLLIKLENTPNYNAQELLSIL